MTTSTAGELLWKIIRNDVRERDPKIDAERVADWMIGYAEENHVLPRAMKAASLCEFDPRPMTALQQKINAWGRDNYRKLTAVMQSATKLADAVLEERARCFGLALAAPFSAALESEAHRQARNPIMPDPYAEAERREQEYRDSRRKRPGRLYPV